MLSKPEIMAGLEAALDTMIAAGVTDPVYLMTTRSIPMAPEAVALVEALRSPGRNRVRAVRKQAADMLERYALQEHADAQRIKAASVSNAKRRVFNAAAKRALMDLHNGHPDRAKQALEDALLLDLQ
jgi:hypothetical protein